MAHENDVLEEAEAVRAEGMDGRGGGGEAHGHQIGQPSHGCPARAFARGRRRGRAGTASRGAKHVAQTHHGEGAGAAAGHQASRPQLPRHRRCAPSLSPAALPALAAAQTAGTFFACIRCKQLRRRVQRLGDDTNETRDTIHQQRVVLRGGASKAYLVDKGAGGGGGELLAGREPRARVEGAARFGEQAEEEGGLLLHARLALGVVGGPHAGTHRGHLPQHLRVCLRAPACLARATHSPRPSAPAPTTGGG